MTNKIIQPKVLKGFRDTLPATALARREMIQKMEQVFSLYGFSPIDTPALEYTEILLGKGSDETDKQLYRFKDNGDRDVALRFDLTVPFARFAAMHINELGTPFKRYHIAPVWRAEKPQRGRYREFIQCDFDIIGTDSILADTEIITVILRTLEKLDLAATVFINNRRLLNGFFDKHSLLDKSSSILRAIDKLEKLGEEIVVKELTEEAGLSKDQIKETLSFIRSTEDPSSLIEAVNEIAPRIKGSEIGEAGIKDVKQIAEFLKVQDIEPSAIKLDLSIARGLDYYTGTIFETKLTKLPEIGSICSGGRYDNLASLYTKTSLPGVGASFGLDRIIAALEELGLITNKSTTANLLITLLDSDCEGETLNVAESIRKNGLAAEVFYRPAKLVQQFKYAEKRGITYVAIIGKTELAEKTCSIKNIVTGTQKDKIPFSNITTTIQSNFS